MGHPVIFRYGMVPENVLLWQCAFLGYHFTHFDAKMFVQSTHHLWDTLLYLPRWKILLFITQKLRDVLQEREGATF